MELKDVKPTERKLIWTADLKFQVKDVDLSTERIQDLCTKNNGAVTAMELTSNPTNVSNMITIRVNNEYFHELVSALKGESIFTDRANVNSNDVTEEYVDIESRLKTKREVRERYVQILRTNTGTISEVIEAEEAIRKITEEIEAKEGRLRYLKDQVAYSTIDVQVYQKVDYIAQPTVYEKPYSEEMGDAFSSGWGEIKAIFIGLVTIWPILLLIFAVSFWKRRWIINTVKEIRGK